jgi:hypothetical protein
VLHDRFSHRPPARLQGQGISDAAADAPQEWGEKLKKMSAHPCDSCLRSKATQLPSKASSPPAHRPGDLVSFDIFTSPTPHRAGGQKYVIGFTDHFSHRQKLYFLANKSDAPDAVERYINCCSSRGVPVKRLHTDNAPEFGETNAPMRAVLERHGLLGALTTCAPYTPRQNGVAERMWRTLMEPAATAKLMRANLPASFW